MRRLLILLIGLPVVTVTALWCLRQWHPGLDQLASTVAAEPDDHHGALEATWLGCAGLYITDGTHSLVIDPFFSRPEGMLKMAINGRIEPDEARIRSALKRLGIERLDAVLVSHSHHDHSMDSGVVARLTGATLIGSDSTLNIGRGAGLAEPQLALPPDASVARTIGKFQVRMIGSAHAGLSGGIPTGEINQPLVPPARYLDYRQGGTYSILVDHPLGSLLHVGSAGHRTGALSKLTADVAFLGVAMIDDIETYLSETVDRVGARQIVPIHWDDFTRPLDKPMVPMPLVVRLDQFLEHVVRTRPQLVVQGAPLFRPVSLGQAEPTSES